MLLTDKARDRAKKNPTMLLCFLLGLHLIVISVNRVPGQPDLNLFQSVLMSIMLPFQIGLTGGTNSVKNWWDSYIALRGAHQQSRQLLEERKRLDLELYQLRDQVKQLDQFKSLKEWQAAHKYQAIEARVVGRDANELFNSVVIDVGTSSGIVKNQPVVSAGGLVGRVIYVAHFSSRVLLITDERHGAGAILGQTAGNRFVGVIRGKSNYLCEMRFIVPPEKLENGEDVLTSGQDGIYPRGILIGRVRKTEGAIGVVQSVVDVEPAAPLRSLETVAVLTLSPEQIQRPIDEVNAEEKKQEKPPDRKRR